MQTLNIRMYACVSQTLYVHVYVYMYVSMYVYMHARTCGADGDGADGQPLVVDEHDVLPAAESVAEGREFQQDVRQSRGQKHRLLGQPDRWMWSIWLMWLM